MPLLMGREFEHPLSEFGSLLSDSIMEIVGKNNDSVAIVYNNQSSRAIHTIY